MSMAMLIAPIDVRDMRRQSRAVDTRRNLARSNAPISRRFRSLSRIGGELRHRTRGTTMNEVTRILSAIEQGDPQAAEQLMPLVYDELRKLAAQ